MRQQILWVRDGAGEHFILRGWQVQRPCGFQEGKEAVGRPVGVGGKRDESEGWGARGWIPVVLVGPGEDWLGRSVEGSECGKDNFWEEVKGNVAELEEAEDQGGDGGAGLGRAQRQGEGWSRILHEF